MKIDQQVTRPLPPVRGYRASSQVDYQWLKAISDLSGLHFFHVYLLSQGWHGNLHQQVQLALARARTAAYKGTMEAIVQHDDECR